ncbi:hypothetical protein D3C80_1874820 [compost metagenome]
MALRATAVGQSFLAGTTITAVLIRTNQHKPSFALLLQQSRAAVRTMAVGYIMRLIGGLAIFDTTDQTLGHITDTAKERVRLALAFGDPFKLCFPLGCKLG